MANEAVAQSGIPSALGMAIETDWGVAPVTVSSGYANVIGKTGCPHRFFIVRPGARTKATGKRVKSYDDIDGSFSLKRNFLTAKEYPISFSFRADAENLYYILLGIFGKDVQSTVQASTVFDHAFKSGLYRPSFTLETIIGNADYGEVNTGFHIRRVEFDFGEDLIVNVGGYAKHHVPNSYIESGTKTAYDFTSSQNLIPVDMGGNGFLTWARTAAPTYVDVATSRLGTGPFVFAGIQYGRLSSPLDAKFLSIDGSGVAVKMLQGTQIAFDKAIDARQIAGSGYDVGACIGNEFMVSGKINALFKDNTFEKAELENSQLALGLMFQGGTVGSSSRYELEFYLPSLRIEDGGPDIAGGTLMMDMPFTAEYDASATHDAAVRLRNTYDNTSQLGTYVSSSSNPGGLGGWVSS